jgi:hypothetical protein
VAEPTDIPELQLSAEGARELADKADAAAEDLRRRAVDLQRRAAAWRAYATTLDAASTDEPKQTRPRGRRRGAPPPLRYRPDRNDYDTLLIDPEPERQRARPAAPPSNKRPLISELVADRPNGGWTPTTVHAELVRLGRIPPETSEASIRVTMSRMFQAGELGRSEDGLYTSPDGGTDSE